MSNDLRLWAVRNPGDLKKEYVWLQAMEEVNLGNYILMDNTFTDDHEVSNTNRHAYVFPQLILKKGTFISLRTRSGVDGMEKSNDGKDMYALHWNHKKTVWNKDGDTAQLFYAPRLFRQILNVPPVE
jgi:hypothetical protein